MYKVHVATTRPVGRRCIDWLRSIGEPVVDDPEECTHYFSVLSSRILDKEFLSTRKAFNFHPAILPKYGGSPVYTMAILNGETESGVTLHEIDEGIDTGQVISIRHFPVRPWDTATDVRGRAEEHIFEMFRDHYAELVEGSYRRVYKKKELEPLKDLTTIIRALTLEGKESAYWINSKGEKIHIKYE